jgi:spermidine/putrescine-binding protein
VANKDNVSLLYHVAGKIKTVRDSRNETFALDMANTGLTKDEWNAPTPEQMQKIADTATSLDPNAVRPVYCMISEGKY